MRKWVVNNLDNDPVKIFRKIYDTLYQSLEPSTIPHAVLIIVLTINISQRFVGLNSEINLVGRFN